MTSIVGETIHDAPQVLVVDDDDDIRGFMQEILAGEGYSSEGAANGQLALRLLRSLSDVPALILLDLTMPQMDGAEFLTCIDEDGALGRIPVALISADPSIRQVFETHRTRFAPFFMLPKPVDLKKLLAIVADVVPTAPAQA